MFLGTNLLIRPIGFFDVSEKDMNLDVTTAILGLFSGKAFPSQILDTHWSDMLAAKNLGYSLAGNSFSAVKNCSKTAFLTFSFQKSDFHMC